VRVERVVLEDHRHVPLARRQARDVALADRDPALGDGLEAGEHAEQRRLAAARRPDQNHELAALDRQADVVDGGDAPGKQLGDAVEDNPAHGGAG
jgi:hypothetical protein